ncbi:hypothetical protein LTR95_002049 [Oleoguttula sp. CCFEE 5521]
MSKRGAFTPIMLAATLLVAFATGALAQQLNGNASLVSNITSSACPTGNGAHIIVARASLEAVGFGTIGAVKDAVLAQVPGSTAEFVNYPATLDAYFMSETTGVYAMRTLIAAYIANCPCQPLVVMGYSQGAQVTADSLVGQQVMSFPDNMTLAAGVAIDQPLPDSTLSRVAAMVIMGDPTFNTSESFHVGNASKNALFPREDVSNFGRTGLASRTQSYCDALDPYCASGSFDSISVHLGYVKEYGIAATTFVVDQLKQYKGCAAGNATGGANGTAGGANGTNGGAAPTSSPPAYTGAAVNVYGASSAMLMAAMAAVFAFML